MAEKTTFEVMHEFVAPARTKLSHGNWDYLMGAAETETTHKRTGQPREGGTVVSLTA